MLKKEGKKGGVILSCKYCGSTSSEAYLIWVDQKPGASEWGETIVDICDACLPPQESKEVSEITTGENPPTTKRRGRPVGSKNKPKPVYVSLVGRKQK